MAVQSGLFDTLQTSFNLVDQKARYGLFQRARSNWIGIIVKRPIGNAIWDRTSVVGGTEGLAGTNLERFNRAQAMLNIGQIPAESLDHIVLSLGYVLASRDVRTAIVGTRNLDHIVANIEAVEKSSPISECVVTEINKRFDLVGKDWCAID